MVVTVPVWIPSTPIASWAFLVLLTYGIVWLILDIYERIRRLIV